MDRAALSGEWELNLVTFIPVTFSQALILVCGVILLIVRNSGPPQDRSIDPWNVFGVLRGVARGAEALVLLIWFDTVWQIRSKPRRARGQRWLNRTELNTKELN